MAVTTALRLVFEGANDKKINFSYNYADEDATGTQVKTLMQTIIANNDIFAEKPLAIVGAELITKDVTELDVA